MSKKTISVLFGFVFLFSFKIADAELVINEIMYAPADGSEHEWVEIFNNGSDSVNLEKYRFFHGQTNSGPLSLKNGSTFSLQPGGYAIIAKSLQDYSWLNSSLMILSASTLSLPDSGNNTYIAISDPDKKIIDSVTYDTSLGGNKNSGNSLSKINNLWQGTSPTPGTKNSSPVVVNDISTSGNTTNTTTTSGNTNSNSSSNNKVSSVQNTSTTKAKVIETPKIKTKIVAKNVVFAGFPVEFKANTTGYANESISYGKYFWNFGDGDSKEIKANDAAKFTHTFFYEGEYKVALEYYKDNNSLNPDASDKINIKAIKADIIISNVGDEKDFFIEISNNTNYDSDLSGWILLGNQKSFILPKNMILEPKKKITLSPKITNFSILDKNTLKLLNPQGEIISDFSSSVKQAPVAVKKTVSAKIPVTENKKLLKNEIKTEIPADDLEAEAVKSNTNTNGENDFKYGVFGLLAFLGIAGSTTYFIRTHNRKPKIEPVADSFEIIDE